MDIWVQYGIVGLSIGVAYKAVEIVGKAIKAKIDGGKIENNPGNGAVIAEIKDLKSEVIVLQTEVRRLSRVVVDGNGGESLVVQVAKINQKLVDHVGDKGLHTAEK